MNTSAHAAERRCTHGVEVMKVLLAVVDLRDLVGIRASSTASGCSGSSINVEFTPGGLNIVSQK
jgi:hypothetical protein